MGKRYLAVVVFLLLFYAGAATAAQSQVRVSVFNFGTVNLEASGLGTTVSNMLIGLLNEDKALAMLDRKELEAFLGMNDLQQNDNIDNVVLIGTRLGLNVIVVGAVEKKGSMIMIQCRAIEVDQKKPILSTRGVAVGDAALAVEVRKLSQQIRTAISSQLAKGKADEGGSFPAPIQVRKRPGSRSIQLSWEDAPGAAAAGYEIFRATAEAGPFSRLAQAARPEYIDETVDKDTLYYYKIRAYNDRGLQSEFSQVVDATTAVTQNPPVILKAEGHVKGIALIWSPGPGSGDPLPLKGYRLYRARAEQGPYRETVNIESRGLGDVSAALDRLLKVPYLDKGLEDGQEYHYRVTAYNEKEMESGFSRPIRGMTTPAVGAVTADGNLIREIRLSWPAIDSPFIRGYHIYRSKEEKEKFVRIKRIELSAGASSRKIEFADKDSLGDQTRYYYRVTAFEEGDSETSPSATVSAVTRGKPAMPEELKVTGGFVKRVELTWKATTAEDVEGYKLYWSKEKEGPYVHLKTLSGRTMDRYTDNARGFDKLEDGTVYHYRLTTYNRVDVESEAAPPAYATTKPRPSKPAGLQGEKAKAKSVPLRWSANPERDIVVYHLFRATGAEGGDFERIAKIQGTETIDKELKDLTVYRYRLQAEDKDGLLSAFSETVSIQTKARPARVEGAEGRVGEGKAVLTWKVSPEPDIAQYTVYEKKFFGMEKITAVRETQFSEPAPSKGKTKTYLVTATDKDGLESEPGLEITVTGP
jgi:fibronectin type 3 domain-containing protein